jgi:uncharacterized protein (TIGR02145 family)
MCYLEGIITLGEYYNRVGIGASYEQCGNYWYTNTMFQCQNGVIEIRPEYYEQNGYERCGSNGWYLPSAQVECQGGIVKSQCGSVGWYNNATQKCVQEYNYSNSAFIYAISDIEKCGGSNFEVEKKCLIGKSYNPEIEFCNGSDVLEKCGGTASYNPTIYLCCNNTVLTKTIYFCSKNQEYTKCGGSEYDPDTQRCQGTVIQTKCGAGWYNAATETCYDGISSSVIHGGKTYKTIGIGNQMWMAENLSYNASGSMCYGEGGQVIQVIDGNNVYVNLTASEIQANCEKYGRLYNWATAMNLDASCNTTSCSTNAKHKGICPDDWHISTRAEWDALINFAGGQGLNASENLRARDLWDNCGPSSSGKDYLCEDTYGFTALPGGIATNYPLFANLGTAGIWWYSSETNSGTTTFSVASISNNGNATTSSNYNKTNLLSVRCLKD